MLLINNLAGPTIVSMPALAQQSGWLAVLVVQLLVALCAIGCGLMLMESMRRMPGNRNFKQTVEFSNIAMFYLWDPFYVLVMFCYFANVLLNLMSLIIQSGQVIDYVMLNTYGCAPGLEFGRTLAYVCGTKTDSVTPFGDHSVISGSLVIVGVLCAPFAVQNLDDNVVLQYLAVIGLSVIAAIWTYLLVGEPSFPTQLPMVTSTQGPLIGTVLFNFAFASSLPSWVNEKRADVSVSASFAVTMLYVVLLYTLVGVVGGMAYPPFFTMDQNLFSKLNAGGSKIGRVTVAAYPMLQNFTSIPVLAILLRNNLVQIGAERNLAILVAVGLPWVLSVCFYTGKGFDHISELGGLATSSVINFLMPVVLYMISLQHGNDA
ncbi:unnamed protein product [Polarella glacialis]|uniref:Amino acid transporter transmembrane domain-containing protein n=1 Tax=Polarella glacialis TaxID=89957 RepID=A0A813DUL4_POLGL|nr:unnamed protein product [Polarella glacialis]